MSVVQSVTEAQAQRLARLVSNPAAVDALLSWWEGLTTPAPGRIVNVPASGNLQSALDAAQPGDTLALPAGAAYTGPFMLRGTRSGGVVTVTGASLPLSGQRARPQDASEMPKLLAPGGGEPAILTEGLTNGWQLRNLEILPANAKAAVGELVRFGDGSSSQNRAELVPRDLTLQGCYIHGWPAGECKRAVSLNCGGATITGCHISDIKRAGQDAQALCGWNGPGPFHIVNNYLEASGENVLFGGSDPWIAGLVPSDIEIRGNHITKPLSWRADPWTVKNLLELKNARRVTITGNLFENNWAQAQAGYAIVLTSVNQDGRAPWSVVEDVAFTDNVLRHSGGGFNCYGGVAGGVRRVTIRNNLCVDLDATAWGGEGAFLQVGAVDALTVAQNTAMQSGSVVKVYSRPSSGFVFRDNVLPHNAYGVLGTDNAVGLPSLAAFFPACDFTENVLIGAGTLPYPPGNAAPSSPDDVFMDWRSGDFHIKPGSPYAHAGCDFAALAAALAAGGEG